VRYRVKLLELEADRSPPSSVEIKNVWSYNSSPAYTFVAHCTCNMYWAGLGWSGLVWSGLVWSGGNIELELIETTQWEGVHWADLGLCEHGDEHAGS
jgi:hypothetical protein